MSNISDALDTPPVPGDPNQENTITYNPENGTFAVTGHGVNLGQLAETAQDLRETTLFREVIQGSAILHITPVQGYGWFSTLPSRFTLPYSHGAVRAKMGQQCDTTLLSYVIGALCDAMMWNGENVLIVNSPIG